MIIQHNSLNALKAEIQRHRHANWTTTNNHNLMTLDPILRSNPLIGVKTKGGLIADIDHEVPSILYDRASPALLPSRRSVSKRHQFG